MKTYSLFLLILLLFSPPAFSAQPIVEYREPDSNLTSVYNLFDYRISNNSFIDGMYISKATILVNRKNMFVRLLAWIEDSGEVEVVANYLSDEQCSFLFKTVMEGIAVSINTDDTDVDSTYSDTDYIYNQPTTDMFSLQNIFWAPIEVGINDFTIRISCQGSI